jgi:hypothetical protein
VRRALAGDEAAFERLVEPHSAQAASAGKVDLCHSP